MCSSDLNGEQLMEMNKQQLEILTELRELRAIVGAQSTPTEGN